MSRIRPRELPRICPSPTCALPVTDCHNPDHTAGGWTDDRVRGNRHERGYGSRYEHNRRRVLARDHRRCQLCGRPGTEVDHRIPVSLGGDHSVGNLRVLCESCHRAKTLEEGAEARRAALAPVSEVDEELVELEDELYEGGGDPLPGPAGTYGGCGSGSAGVLETVETTKTDPIEEI